MKINALQQSEIISKYTDNATHVSAKKTDAANSLKPDSVELSSGAQKYAQLIRQARAELDGDSTQESERADEIASQIKSGSYSVSDSDLADALAGKGNIPTYC